MDGGGAPPGSRLLSTRGLVLLNCVYGAVLMVLAYVPRIPALGGITVPDLVAHAVAYGLQAVFLLALLRRLVAPGTAAVAAAAGAVLFGGFTELLQLLQPTRATELHDLMADAVGAALAVGVVHLAGSGAGGLGSDR